MSPDEATAREAQRLRLLQQLQRAEFADDYTPEEHVDLVMRLIHHQPFTG